MSGNTILNGLSRACAVMLLAACADQSAVPTALQDAERSAVIAGNPPTTASADVNDTPPAFTARATIDPYFINQAPDIMLRSQVRSDLVVQRLVTNPSVGGWHTHPGPSLAIVERGRVEITRYSRKDGCVATVYGPGELAGQTYYEVAGEVHRASVLQPETAVEYKVRFNVPVGATSFATPADDPGC